MDQATATTDERSEDIYLSSPQVKRRYGGVSENTLSRWLHETKVGFPRPIILGGRYYWRLRDLLEFEDRVRLPPAV